MSAERRGNVQDARSGQQLAPWEQQLHTMGAAVPYLLLAAATLLAALSATPSAAHWLGTLVLAGLAAGWMLWLVTLHPAWATHRGVMALYYAGLLALIALLMARSPWFGLFAFTGYLHAWQLLPGRWRLLGVTTTALLATTWQTDGLPRLDSPALAPYLVIVTVTVLLVSLFSTAGEVTAAQSRQRQQMVAELAEANRRLEAALTENATLQAQLLAQAREAGVQDERQRLAGEIHDTLAQGFTGIITQLEAAEHAAEHPSQWRRHLYRARDLARASLVEARRSVQALQPAPLEAAPLPAALAALIEDWSRQSEVSAELTVTGMPQPLLAELEGTLYRVAQEALSNVSRHARARRARVTLSYMEDIVVLDVRDDGVGFEGKRVQVAAQAREHHGHGLPGMERRLERVGGSLTLESVPGQGTALSASVPALGASDGRGAP